VLSRHWKRIITISSGAGQTGMNTGVSPYAAGKVGAAGFYSGGENEPELTGVGS
jgi:NAD(P)-dependent dehydrogenase (short-subunit alcohol dehydrogenase family)